MQHIATLSLFVLALVSGSYQHGAITGAKGLNGINGRALGIKESTPRDCTQRNPCQQDSAIIDDREIASGRAGACGRTLGGGRIDMQSEVQNIMSDLGGLPSVAPGQPLTLTVHQVNGDGAGPFNCELDQTGTGKSFQNLEVSTQVPGRNGRNRKGQKTDHPLVVQMPQNLACTGGADGNMCMVRCRNPIQGAGPFGGCVPVVMDNGAGAGNGNAGNATKTPSAKAAAPPPAAAADNDAAETNQGAQKQGGRLRGLFGRKKNA